MHILHKSANLVISAIIIAISVLIVPSSLQAAGTGYWHTEGNKILDSQNQQVRIAGVNWFGLETGTFAPHGLWARGYKEQMDQMKSAGFNAIRLPYSNDIFNTANKPNAVDWTKNQDLVNKSGLEIMDAIVAYAGKLGLRIILDRHRPTVEGQSELWYTDKVSESKWIEDWKALARRYKNNPTVIGADLHNEPHGNACWGCGDTSRDWRLAAERAGNAILSENPNLLIIVEGVETYNNHWYWWGGQLEAAKDHPVRLNVAKRVVYSTHDYPQSVWGQSWFNASNYPQNLPGIWDMIWGYLHKNNTAPVLIGEMGSKLETTNDKQWHDSLISYIKTNNISWFYWSWNPNSVDTGGILQDDWTTVRTDKVDKLKPVQFALDAAGTVAATATPMPSTPTATSSPSATATPTKPAAVTTAPTAAPTTQSVQTTVATPTVSSSQKLCRVEYKVLQSWNNDGYSTEVRIHNISGKIIDGWYFEMNFSGNQSVKNLWNGTYSQSGSYVQVKPHDWNKSIAAGSNVSFGYVGGYSGSNNNPSEFKLNGVKCD